MSDGHGVSRSSSTKLELSISATTGREHVAFIERKLRAAHAMVRPVLGELSVALVGDTTMSRLHEQFMGIPGPTDVLTFPLEEDSRGRSTSGEVIVCVPEARRRAGEGAEAVRRELLLYALHGMLHLCGYDDRTERDYRRMHRAEDQILTRLGVGPVFDAGVDTVGRTTPRRGSGKGPRSGGKER